MTFVLIPSFACETCVAETVRRQLARPFARSAIKEEAVIRERFPIYLGLPAQKIETMRPINAVIDELLATVLHQRQESEDGAAAVVNAVSLPSQGPRRQ